MWWSQRAAAAVQTPGEKLVIKLLLIKFKVNWTDVTDWSVMAARLIYDVLLIDWDVIDCHVHNSIDKKVCMFSTYFTCVCVRVCVRVSWSCSRWTSASQRTGCGGTGTGGTYLCSTWMVSLWWSTVWTLPCWTNCCKMPKANNSQIINKHKWLRNMWLHCVIFTQPVRAGLTVTSLWNRSCFSRVTWSRDLINI